MKNKFEQSRKATGNKTEKNSGLIHKKTGKNHTEP